MTHLSIFYQFLERLRLPGHGGQEPVLLERIGVYHLVDSQRQTRITVFVDLRTIAHQLRYVG